MVIDASRPDRRPGTWGRSIYALIALALGAAYVAVGVEPLRSLANTPSYARGLFFGFSQVGVLAERAPIALGALASLGVLLFHWRPQTSGRRRQPEASGIRPVARSGLALLAVVVFFLLRSNSPNPDGVSFTEKFERNVPLHGAHVTHDEMWEFYLHSRFWLYSNRAFGWSVEQSYQVLSCLAGGVFVFLLLTYCARLLPRNPLSLSLIHI